MKNIIIISIILLFSTVAFSQKQCKIVPGGGEVTYEYRKHSNSYYLTISNYSDKDIYVSWRVINPVNIENRSGRPLVRASLSNSFEIRSEENGEYFHIDDVQIEVSVCD